MNSIYELNSVIEEISTIKTLEEAWYILCKLSIIFEKEDVNNIFSQDEFKVLVKITDEVFKNKTFFELTKKGLIESRQDSNEDANLIDEKKLIRLFLQIAFFGYTIYLNKLEKSQIGLIRSRLCKANRDLEKAIENGITYENILIFFENICAANKYQFKEHFPLEKLKVNKINADFLFSSLIRTVLLANITLVSLPYMKFISLAASRNANRHISAKLSELYGASTRSNGIIKLVQENYLKKFPEDHSLERYIEMLRTSNEKIISFIIEKITSNFQYNKELSFEDRLHLKLENVTNIKTEIIKYCENNLSAFNIDLAEKIVWANKIFLATIKLLATLEEIQRSKDISWQRNVAVREFNLWLKNIHKIINRNELIDDWSEISKFLKEETNQIEWKTSFFTPVQEKFINEPAEKKKSDELFFSIIKTIVGMMNADGGTIIIGICEHPEEIMREDVLSNTIVKGVYTFYNISHELDNRKYNKDILKRHIQDKLKKETLLSIEKIDKYWELNSFELGEENNYEKRATIYRIDVRKADSFIYFTENKDEIYTVKLLMRVNKRTIFVDPRTFLDEN
jgi:hypothetical protein